jgi:TfoX/Sxy family transcriptional regulator of competence genes
VPAASDARDFAMAALLGLDDVTSRRMFGCDAFLNRARMFAFLTDRTMVARVPEPRRTRLLARRQARPFLVAPGTAFGTWIEMRLRTSAEVRLALRMARLAHADTVNRGPASCTWTARSPSPTTPPRTTGVMRRP